MTFFSTAATQGESNYYCFIKYTVKRKDLCELLRHLLSRFVIINNVDVRRFLLFVIIISINFMN